MGIQVYNQTLMNNKTQFSTVDLEALGQLVQALRRQQINATVIENINDAYKIQIPKYSPSDLADIAICIEQRASKARAQRLADASQIEENHWFLGEKSLFFCVLGFYAFLHRINIESITEEQIWPLQKIFCSKCSKALFFQVRHLLSLGLKTEWGEEDITLLGKIVNGALRQAGRGGCYSVKWKKVAYELFLRSRSGQFYSARDCRNRWLSHLSPEVSKTSWTTHEELRLCHFIADLGCKWSLISRRMGGVRTEHMVKNKINSLMNAVFRKKFKVITKKHIDKIVETLKMRVEVEGEVETGMLGELLSSGESMEALEQQPSLTTQQEDLKERRVRDFEGPFISQRLVFVPHSFEDSWEYEQEPAHTDLSCFLTLN